MTFIAAGSFPMGLKDAYRSEGPVHVVKVEAFCMDTTEVTTAAYDRCMRDGPCNSFGLMPICNAVSHRQDHPMNCVNFDEAVRYCDYVGKRLPTEQEWEYAARGREGRTYPWGEAEPNSQLCWRAGRTCPVGSFPADRSPWGVIDLAGNVSEWTASFGSRDYLSPADPSRRVVKGHCWMFSGPAEVPSGRRWQSDPTERSHYYGFRCARSASPAPRDATTP
jgi:formylglycine-generating enzyme required for sulfatase activity